MASGLDVCERLRVEWSRLLQSHICQREVEAILVSKPAVSQMTLAMSEPWGDPGAGIAESLLGHLSGKPWCLSIMSSCHKRAYARVYYSNRLVNRMVSQRIYSESSWRRQSPFRVCIPCPGAPIDFVLRRLFSSTDEPIALRVLEVDVVYR
jgi:hypothetical protein